MKINFRIDHFSKFFYIFVWVEVLENYFVINEKTLSQAFLHTTATQHEKRENY